MKIVKFEGATLRDALARVKAELGDQAVIVSTRQIRRGLLGSAYEIAAAVEPEDERGGLPSTPRFATSPSAAYGKTNAPAPRGAVDDAIAPVKAELRSLRAMVRAASSSSGSGDKAAAELRTELASLRKRLDDIGHGGRAARHDDADDDDRSAHDDRHVRATRDMRDTRSPLVAAAAGAAARASRDTRSPKKVELARTTEIAAPSDAQVVALVGPTGVGKTTTIAKIAARAALVDGKRVALISLDNYRVGGVDQIRTFADLIGVPLSVAEKPQELIEHVAQLDDHDLILVDTAGRSPRDAAAIDELSRAINRVRGIETHLAISAATAPNVIDDLARRYAALRPARLLFTKLDETDAVPELVDAPARLALPITWITTGQAVPEDLEEATAQRLVELARFGLQTAHRAA